MTHPKGSPERPLNQDELHEKFRRLTSDVISEHRQDAIITMVADLESVADIGDFAKLIGAEQGQESQ